MSLAFALMAAINGSTGSRATLSFGLLGPSLVGVSPAARRFSSLRVAAQAARVTVLKIAAILGPHGWPRAARDAVNKGGPSGGFKLRHFRAGAQCANRCTLGSVRGAAREGGPYRERCDRAAVLAGD
jgi:hypothetical protein